MKSWIKIAAVLALCGWSGTDAGAASVSGNYLFEQCTEYKHEAGTIATGFCLGYITGIAELSIQTRAICPAHTVSDRQIFDVVYQYLDEHPATRDSAATIQVVAALALAFPCQKPPQRPD